MAVFFRKKPAILGVVALLTLATLFVFHHHLSSTTTTFTHAIPRVSSLVSDRARLVSSLVKAFTSRSTKTIVYDCTSGACGGWADRQKGIVGAYVLAAMMGRKFGVRINIPCDVSQHLDNNRINWTMGALDTSAKKLHWYIYLDSDASNYAQNLALKSDLDPEFPYDVSVLRWNMEVVQFLKTSPLAANISWIMENPVPDIYRSVLNDLFLLKPGLQKQLDDLQKARPPGTKLACAQMRLGKHNGSFPDVESWHTFEEVPILVNFLAKYNDSSKFRLLFASDSVEVIERVRKLFPEVFLTIPGPITHTDKSQGADKCDGFKKAIVDQYALSLCDILVISESGIGKIASFLRGTDKELYLFHDVKIEPFTRDGKFPNKHDW